MGRFSLEDENRLKELVVNILRRQGDEVIASGAPIDKEYVMQRSPQLGNGLKIKTFKKKRSRNFLIPKVYLIIMI